MPDFICTTILEYPDRYEGQVMHYGDEESCQEVADMIPAVAINGDETPVAARIAVAPAEDFGYPPNGQLWRQFKVPAE